MKSLPSSELFQTVNIRTDSCQVWPEWKRLGGMIPFACGMLYSVKTRPKSFSKTRKMAGMVVERGKYSAICCRSTEYRSCSIIRL